MREPDYACGTGKKMSRQDYTSIVRPRPVKTVFNLLWQEAFSSNQAIALWRLPDSGDRHLIMASPKKWSTENYLEEATPGFIFAPFDSRKAPVFLEASLHFTYDGSSGLEGNDSRSQEWLSGKEGGEEQLFRPPSGTDESLKRQTTTEAGFHKMVSHALEAIHQGVFEKVVVSRVKEVPLPDPFDAFEMFEQLCSVYSNALVSLVYLPGSGIWLGATPEILVHTEEGRQFRTSAVAGTQRYNDGIDLKQVAWTQKEIEEQALVSRYIINCFKKIRLREFEEVGPRTVVAGNLLHLKTEYSVDLESVSFPLLGSVMLKLLHPTSAVCGMPLEPARTFIQSHEGFDRLFYTGFLGPVNMHRTTSIYVNLRCMQIVGSHALLYAGAGITSDSDPAREWEETEIKLGTLLNVI